MPQPPRAPTTRRLTVTTAGDRHAVEALQLEIRRLARVHGLEVTDIRVAPVAPRRRRRSR